MCSYIALFEQDTVRRQANYAKCLGVPAEFHMLNPKGTAAALPLRLILTQPNRKPSSTCSNPRGHANVPTLHEALTHYPYLYATPTRIPP
jgi:hypothetical protein